MSAWQQTYFTIDWANGFEIAAIRAHPVVQDFFTHRGFQFFFVERDDFFQAIREFKNQGRDQFILYHTQRRRARCFVGVVYGCLETWTYELGHPASQCFVRWWRSIRPLGFVHGLRQFLLHRDDVLQGLVTEAHCF